MTLFLRTLLSRLIGTSPVPASSDTRFPVREPVNLNRVTGAVDDGETAPHPPLSQGELRIMNLKELVETISQETAIPAAQVRKVSTAMLEKFSELIEQEENFRSPIVYLNSTTIPAKGALGAQPAQPERKIARMFPAPIKESA